MIKYGSEVKFPNYECLVEFHFDDPEVVFMWGIYKIDENEIVSFYDGAIISGEEFDLIIHKAYPLTDLNRALDTWRDHQKVPWD